ncbi:hypothetical protein M1506_03425 [Patescibacteria group bacterium]|nr:hypothetical protein [Patescibacteria group bacterium]
MSIFSAKISAWFGKNKGWIIVVTLILFLMAASFLLGYFYGTRDNPAPIIIEKQSV